MMMTICISIFGLVLELGYCVLVLLCWLESVGGLQWPL
jgi:hypothetical protein